MRGAGRRFKSRTTYLETVEWSKGPSTAVTTGDMLVCINNSVSLSEFVNQVFYFDVRKSLKEEIRLKRPALWNEGSGCSPCTSHSWVAHQKNVISLPHPHYLSHIGYTASSLFSKMKMQLSGRRLNIIFENHIASLKTLGTILVHKVAFSKELMLNLGEWLTFYDKQQALEQLYIEEMRYYVHHLQYLHYWQIFVHILVFVNTTFRCIYCAAFFKCPGEMLNLDIFIL